MFSALCQPREHSQHFLLDLRMDNSIQLRQLSLIIEDDCCKTAAINAFVGIQNCVAKKRNNFVVSRLAGLHHLMCDSIRFHNRKTKLTQHRRNGGLTTRDSPGQSVAQHYEVNAPRMPAAICRINGAAARPSRCCSSAW